MNRYAVMILTAGLVAGTPLTHADTIEDSSPRMLVSAADLDLSQSAGLKAFYGRLRSAAERVCASSDGRDVGRTVAHKRCVSDAIARAVTEVDKPALTAYYRAKIGDRNTESPKIVLQR